MGSWGRFYRDPILATYQTGQVTSSCILLRWSSSGLRILLVQVLAISAAYRRSSLLRRRLPCSLRYSFSLRTKTWLPCLSLSLSADENGCACLDRMATKIYSRAEGSGIGIGIGIWREAAAGWRTGQLRNGNVLTRVLMAASCGRGWKRPTNVLRGRFSGEAAGRSVWFLERRGKRYFSKTENLARQGCWAGPCELRGSSNFGSSGQRSGP